MKENALIELSKQFAVDIVNLCTDIKEHRKSNILLNQLLRSGTSIGANIHEANYASSKADFINIAARFFPRSSLLCKRAAAVVFRDADFL